MLEKTKVVWPRHGHDYDGRMYWPPELISATNKLCLLFEVFFCLPGASANHDILNSDKFFYPRFYLWWQRENSVLKDILLKLHSLVIIVLLHLRLVYISNPRFEASTAIIRWPMWITIYRSVFRLDLISFYLFSR